MKPLKLMKKQHFIPFPMNLAHILNKIGLELYLILHVIQFK